MDLPDAHTLSQNLDTVFKKFSCAAKFKVAFGFVLKTVEEGTCRYCYAHEKIPLTEQSRLVAIKEDLVRVKNGLSKTYMSKTCLNERANTLCKFYKLTNVTSFAVLLRKVPMCSKTQ